MWIAIERNDKEQRNFGGEAKNNKECITEVFVKNSRFHTKSEVSGEGVCSENDRFVREGLFEIRKWLCLRT